MKTSIADKIFNKLNIILMILLSIVMLYPYLNVAATAFNDAVDSSVASLLFFPRVPTLDNILGVLGNPTVSNAGVVTICRVILGTTLSVIVIFSAAYAFTKKKMMGRTYLLIYFIIPMFFSGGLIPIYILFAKMHLLSNFLVYIIPGAFGFYSMIIVRTYIYTIPESLFESARIDGAGEARILVRIVIPLSFPILATIALWSAVGHWNDWVSTLYYCQTKTRLYTLQYLLYQYMQETERITELIRQNPDSVGRITVKLTPLAVKSAQVVITTLPIIMVYPFLQKYFIKGVMIGSVKE